MEEGREPRMGAMLTMGKLGGMRIMGRIRRIGRILWEGILSKLYCQRGCLDGRFGI